jgi:hypothetical protein
MGRSLGLAVLFAGMLPVFALAGDSTAPVPLKVVGNRLLYRTGQPAQLRGVNCASLEWSCDGAGHILKSVQVAVTEWNANLIRLPLCQDRWFGKTSEQQDGGAAYRALVGQLIDLCATNHAYIVLDLHWSDAGVWGQNIGQHNLPDTNSILFWKDVAATYKNRPAVLFDLYNEPSHITWDQWLKGGPMTEDDKEHHVKLSYQAAGMQALVDAIRSTGASNVLTVSGINWAYEFEGIPQSHQLSDPGGNGIIYAAHPYPHAYEKIGHETLAKWTARMEAFAAKEPLIVLEFGSIESLWPFPKSWDCNDEKWNREMIRVLEAHGWSWAAWDFHTTAWPCVIADWNYTPTPHFGVWVKQALAANLGPAQPPAKK